MIVEAPDTEQPAARSASGEENAMVITALTILGLFALRLGVPLLGTLALGELLRRLSRTGDGRPA